MAARTRTSLFLDPDLVEGLKRVKTQDGVPEAEQIRRAVRAWLEARGAIAPRKEGRPKKRS